MFRPAKTLQVLPAVSFSSSAFFSSDAGGAHEFSDTDDSGADEGADCDEGDAESFRKTVAQGNPRLSRKNTQTNKNTIALSTEQRRALRKRRKLRRRTDAETATILMVGRRLLQQRARALSASAAALDGKGFIKTDNEMQRPWVPGRPYYYPVKKRRVDKSGAYRKQGFVVETLRSARGSVVLDEDGESVILVNGWHTARNTFGGLYWWNPFLGLGSQVDPNNPLPLTREELDALDMEEAADMQAKATASNTSAQASAVVEKSVELRETERLAKMAATSVKGLYITHEKVSAETVFLTVPRYLSSPLSLSVPFEDIHATGPTKARGGNIAESAEVTYKGAGAYRGSGDHRRYVGKAKDAHMQWIHTHT